jgi:hypothetical protein
MPLIRREGIRWRGGLGGAPLEIALAFENPSPRPSAPAEARIEVADFGAFLPWRPLTAVAVPPIPPGGRVVVTATAAGDRPRGQLTFPGIVDRQRARDTVARVDALTTLAAAAARSIAWSVARRFRAGGGLESVHFVGNLNVYVSRSRPVERHMQQAVGLQAGATNVTMFCVGDGRDDSYSFRLEAEPGWKVDLEGIRWDRPVLASRLHVLACIVPPAKAESGRLAVWVRRASTGQEVPVEFELTAQAPGPRCYGR